MLVEWDPEKNDSNEIKDGISFLDALVVFDDPDHLIEDVTKPEYGESRNKAVGKIGSRYFTIIIIIIITDRVDIRRIISVRRARTNERRQYDQGKEKRRWHIRSNPA